MDVGRYGFYNIFNYNPQTGQITPLYNVKINNLIYQQNIPIFNPGNFGGLNLYNYFGRDIAGRWEAGTATLDILGFY